MWVKYLRKERRKLPPAGNHFGGIRKKEKKKKKERERGGGKKKRILFFFSLFLSQIYGNRTIGFLWTKKQSSSTHRGLHVGTIFEEFRQTP